MTQFNNPQNSDSIYSDHLINQIHLNLDLLLQQSKISHNSVNIIKEALPASANRAGVGLREPSLTANSSHQTHSPSPQPSFVTQNVYSQSHQPQTSFPVAPQPTHAPSPQRFQHAVALWAYRGSAPEDLHFEKGDTIVILSQDNEDWWKGQIVNSQQPAGLFPSNHVEIIPPPAQSNVAPSLAPYPPHQSAAPYHLPPPQAQPGWQQPPGYSSQPTDLKAPPPMQYTQSPPAPVNVTVQKPKKNMLQGRFGQALAGGAGFGAGSAVASHVVNAIL